MSRKIISVVAFCSMMAAPAAYAKMVNVPLPPERPAAPVSTEAPFEVVQVQARDPEIPGKNVQDIIQSGRSRQRTVDPIATLNDRGWDWRHRVGYRSDFDTDCVTATTGGSTQNTSAPRGNQRCN